MSLDSCVSQILTKFSKNKEIIKQYQRESDVGHEDVSKTDLEDWRAREKIRCHSIHPSFLVAGVGCCHGNHSSLVVAMVT